MKKKEEERKVKETEVMLHIKLELKDKDKNVLEQKEIEQNLLELFESDCFQAIEDEVCTFLNNSLKYIKD